MKKFYLIITTLLMITILWGIDICNPLPYTKDTYMIPMRDGIKLATDVYIPNKGGPKYPVILARTPYNKNNLKSFAKNLTLSGYVSVFQDIRGRYASEGEFNMFLEDGWGEKQDGYDTVEWINQQSWSNGKIGTFGGSALGITQYLMASSNPKNLTCQTVTAGTGNLYADAIFPGGAFLKSLIEGWLSGIGEDGLIPMITENATYSSHWDPVNITSRYEYINAPAFHLGGWYDIFVQGTIDAFVGMQKSGGEGALNKQQMVIGPWTHGGLGQTKQGELTYPENAKSWTNEDYFTRWNDYWLKDIDNGVENDPSVYYYVMGDVYDSSAPGNEWRTSQEWPISATEIPLYFHSDRTLSTEVLEFDPPDTYIYDPNNPVPTIGGNNLTIPAGPYDQSSLEERADVLVYTTPILKEPIEVTGRIKAKLWISSTAIDTDFTVKLTDVYPDGKSMLVADGIIRTRYREGFDHEVFMIPGKIYSVEVDLWSTSIIFNKGHKIRVAISSSNYPRFNVNCNTGASLSEELKPDSIKLIATQTLYHNKEYPSHILLPVIR